MNDKAIYPAVLASIRKDVPDYEVRDKSTSPLMKFIAGILFFSPDFMDHFITTLGATTYAPPNDIPPKGYDWGTIAHEGVHARDDKRWGWLFKLSYLPLLLSPLALFALLAIPFSNWFLLFLLFLLAIPPFPAPARVYWERRGYLMTACCDALTGTNILADSYVDWMVKHYCSGQYYWMAWSKTHMREVVLEDMHRALRIVNDDEVVEPYSSTLAIVRQADAK